MADAQSPPVSADLRAAFELAHAGTLHRFSELVEELGGDPRALMAEAGVDPETLAQPAPRVSIRAIIALLALAAQRLGVPDFGMRLAHRQGGRRSFGVIGEVMRNCGTFGEAIRYVEAHAHAYSLAASMRVIEDPVRDRVFIGWDLLLDGVPRKAQLVEQVMLLGHRNAVEITAGWARVRRVTFRHQPLANPRVYRDYFGCEVLFDQPADGILFTREDMAAPIVDPDPANYRRAAYWIDANFPKATAPVHARVRGLLIRHMGIGDCRVERIADALGLHPRTLHRRLRAEHTAFEDIKDEVRRDAASYYLEQTEVAFIHVAEKLGYSETSVLSRSCLRWFGACPRDVRARARRAPLRADAV